MAAPSSELLLVENKLRRCNTVIIRLQQPVQNPISDNTNVLWNSPSLGKNSIGTPGFIKPPFFYLLTGKKQGQTHLFFPGIAHYLGCVKNSKKSVELHCFEFQSN